MSRFGHHVLTLLIAILGEQGHVSSPEKQKVDSNMALSLLHCR
jgi:hypothetical protein